MKHRWAGNCALGAAVCGVVLALLSAGSVGVQNVRAATAVPPEGVAAERDKEDAILKPKFEAVCGSCHDSGQATNGGRRTVTGWRETIEQMVAFGAPVSPEDKALVQKYLVRHYGLVNVNTAPANELAEALEISATDADAMVKFRTANGPFSDFTELSKVPGIDATTLKLAEDSIIFK